MTAGRRKSRQRSKTEVEKTAKLPTEETHIHWGRLLMRSGIVLAVALSMALAGAQLVLPRMVENQLSAGIQKSAGPAEMVHVNVNAFPAWQLLQGKMQNLTVDVRHAHINDLKVEAFLVDAHNLEVDPTALRQGKGLSIKAADSLKVSAIVSEDDLNSYIWSKVDKNRAFRVRLSPEWTGLKGSVNVLGNSIGVDIRGHFAVVERTRVAFRIDDVQVERTIIPRFIIDALIPHTQWEIDLAQAPVPLEVRNLRVEDGRLFIYGQRPQNLPQTGTAGS